jgi:hypothetical protein
MQLSSVCLSLSPVGENYGLIGLAGWSAIEAGQRAKRHDPQGGKEAGCLAAQQ